MQHARPRPEWAAGELWLKRMVKTPQQHDCNPLHSMSETREFASVRTSDREEVLQMPRLDEELWRRVEVLATVVVALATTAALILPYVR